MFCKRPPVPERKLKDAWEFVRRIAKCSMKTNKKTNPQLVEFIRQARSIRPLYGNPRG